MHAVRWAISARYRRLCRARAERARRNRERCVREWRAVRDRLTAEYIAAEDYGDARRLVGLLMSHEIHGRIHGIY